MEAFALLLSIGLDPDKNVVFVQSHVNTHAQLACCLLYTSIAAHMGGFLLWREAAELLGGEKIDIVKYSDVPEEFIAAALAPADVVDVTVEEGEEKVCRVKMCIRDRE